MIKTKVVPFVLDWEWLPGSASAAPERVTRARLRMAIGADVVTLLADLDGGRVQEHVEAPLYPLAQWIARNWWSLVADARPGTMISQLRFAYKNGVADDRAPWVVRSRRHVLRAAGAGYHWPDVLVVPEGRQTRVVWMPDTAPLPSICYLSRGNALVDSAAFVGRLAELVDAVVARLDEQGVTGTRLQQDWSVVRGTDDEEATFFRLAAQLGLDPVTEAHAYRDDILDVAAALRPGDIFDFFNGVGRNRLRDRLEWVTRAYHEIGSAPADQSDTVPITELRKVCADLREMFHAPGRMEDPWDVGAEAALRVRAWLGLSDTERFDPAPFMHCRVRPTPYLDRGLVAAGSRRGRRGPTLVTARPFDDRPRRFLQCRALWHLICGEEEDFLIVAAHTHRQHVARGFALEALAPATGIARLLGDPEHLVTAEDVEQIADDYLCGNIVVEHQLDNRVTAIDFRWEPDPAVLDVLRVRQAAGQPEPVRS